MQSSLTCAFEAARNTAAHNMDCVIWLLSNLCAGITNDSKHSCVNIMDKLINIQLSAKGSLVEDPLKYFTATALDHLHYPNISVLC